MIQAIAIIAGLLNVFSGASYLRQVLRNESTPNPATWLIWLVVTLLNSSTYFFVVSGNVWIWLASVATTVMVFAIFIIAISKRKFTRLGKVEMISLFIAVCVGIFWRLTGNASVSNLALQVIFIISFIPTIYGILYKGALERPLPWFLAVVSYILQITNVFLTSVSLVALGFPVVNLMGQGIIGSLVWIKNKKDKNENSSR
jgi:hypothetical protein